jgi:hypothetical protein
MVPSNKGATRPYAAPIQWSLTYFRWISYPVGLKRVGSRKRSHLNQLKPHKMPEIVSPGARFLSIWICKYKPRAIIGIAPKTKIAISSQFSFNYRPSKDLVCLIWLIGPRALSVPSVEPGEAWPLYRWKIASLTTDSERRPCRRRSSLHSRTRPRRSRRPTSCSSTSSRWKLS